MKNLFVYLDPGFLSQRGHYRNFAKQIHTYVDNDNDLEIMHFVNKNVDKEDIEKYKLNPIFDHIAYIDDQFEDSRLKIILTSFKKHLTDIFKKIKLQENKYDQIIFYMYTSHPHYIKIFALLNQEFRIKNIEIHLVLFYLNNAFCEGNKDSQYLNLLNNTDQTLADHDLKNKIYLHIDSDRAIEIYQPYFSNKINALPIPLNYRTKMEIKDNKVSRKNEKISLGYFGYPTNKHGFHLFYDLYTQIKDNKKFSFIVRANRHLSDKTFDEEIDQMKKDKNVSFYDEYISDKTYKSLIQNSDIIIIPYLKDAYPVQTSGVFIDATFANKHIVTTEDTWMGDKILILNNGVTFKDENSHELVKTLKTLVDQLPFTFNHTEMENFKNLYTVNQMFETFSKTNKKKNILLQHREIKMTEDDKIERKADFDIVANIYLDSFEDQYRIIMKKLDKYQVSNEKLTYELADMKRKLSEYENTKREVSEYIVLKNHLKSLTSVSLSNNPIKKIKAYKMMLAHYHSIK